MPQNTDTDKRYSVCIGINTYPPETGLGPLNYAENDARDMDEALGRRGFLPENRILLLGADATLDAVNTALGTIIFDRAKENDLVVIYFAGHSTPVTVEDRHEGRRSEVFLATSDFNRKIIQDSSFFRVQNSLGMERLRRTFFEGLGSRKRLFIFDSCYSGDFYGPGYRDGVNQVPNYIQNMLNSGTTGRIFIASCLPYQKAVESSDYGHGHFTYYLLQALNGETQESLRRDGTLTAGSLFDYLNEKLQDQKPVKGGVEFGSFELARFPVPSITGKEQVLDEEEQGKEARLRSTHIIDQTDYVQDRLQRFVGRQTELNKLQDRIAAKMANGGHVIITGDAGQGKSSIIAKLIADRGLDRSVYHFAQRGSGRDSQINLLRNLIARLILKYDLPEYYIAGEGYEILCGNFFGVLKAIANKGQEVIYIDGLDQFTIGSPTSPDMSFLPDRPPRGIVIVVGTRPNQALDQVLSITNLKPNDPYPLPGLNREDFDLLLQRHRVSLPAALRDSLYRRLTNNPLYLDLVAQELRESHDLYPEELIARVENNPNSIFTITFSRMRQQNDKWYNVIRPILGVLLVAQEPLTAEQITHISSHQDSGPISEGIKDLGGLLTPAGQQRFALFHPKLNEYLKEEHNPGNGIQFSAEDVARRHGQVAQWCEQEALEQLWLPLFDPRPGDDYQKYAQKHYIFHLYEARNYERLFAVLNEGVYERGKLRFDRSTHSSAVDLMLGCKAAARRARMLEEGKKLLTHLWRYTLLRTNLTSRADAYPIEAFQALLELGREQEALNLAELLTKPAKKLVVLTLMAEYLLRQPARKTDGLQLVNRVYEIAISTRDNDTQVGALKDLTTALIRAGRLAQAEDIARLIVDKNSQAAALDDVSDAYGRENNWQRAVVVARLIAIDEERVRALSHLAAQLKLAHEDAEAERVWQEASTIVSAIGDDKKRDRANYYLAVSFMQACEWERGETAAHSIDRSDEKVRAWSQLALSFMQAELAELAKTAWDEAEAVIAEMDERDKDTAYRVYAITQIQGGLYTEAETTARRKITINLTERAVVFSSLASHLMRDGLWVRSQRIIDLIAEEYDRTDVAFPQIDNIMVHLSIDLARGEQWEQAKEVALSIPRKEAQCRALMGMVSELVRAGQSQCAQSIWEEARIIATVQTDTVQVSVAAILVMVLVKAGRIAQAKEIISTLTDKQMQEQIMEETAGAFVRVGQIAEAEKIADEITHSSRKDTIRQSIAIAQIQAGQANQAIATVHSITHEERRSRTLVELVKTCCYMQQWQLAQEIANQIPSVLVQADALSHIVVGLIEAGKVTEAEKVARSIRNEFLKADVLCNAATILARRGSFDQANKLANRIKKNPHIRQKALSNITVASLLGATEAESTAHAIDSGNERDEALCAIATTYAHSQLWDDAKRIAAEINGVRKRDETWVVLAIELANTEQWTQAITTFDKIQKQDQRIIVLQEWGKLLVRLNIQGIREEIVQHLSKSEERAGLLVSVADALIQAGNDLDQIHLTQQAWLQASTKDDCQYLFAMVRDLLLRNAELCKDFYDSFRWVNTFLNE
jgi:tetratricopeptide (TPR) repeat protein